MTRTTRQRAVRLTLLALSSLGVIYLVEHYAPTVPRLPFLSGWALIGLMLVLTAFNARKRLSFLPLGTAEGWLQFHAYAGAFSAVLFAAHVRWRVPTGWFEGTLAALFLVVFGSGLAGLALSRALPRRLTTRGGEVIFEEIPVLRRRLQETSESLALRVIAASNSTTVPDYYLRRLKGFFESPPHFWRQLLGDRREFHVLLREINDLHRFLDESERETLRQMAELIRRKDGLDYHQVLQRTLKLWLFVHIPFTYALLVFSFVHLVLVYAFTGGGE